MADIYDETYVEKWIAFALAGNIVDEAILEEARQCVRARRM